MRRERLKLLFCLFGLTTSIIILSIPLFSLPPLGKIVNPFIGGVQNYDDDGFIRNRLIKCNGLIDSVNIYFDENQVPHIYANEERDLYFAQGYVTAYLRLWQMDLTAYYAGGRLSEIFGKSFIDDDRTKRRTGMRYGAVKTLEFIEQTPETLDMLTSYTAGVNAYISSLKYKNLPLEYKLLDYEPEQWSNLKTVLIMKYMANMLTGYEQDASMTKMVLALGEEKFNILFPNHISQAPPVSNTNNGKSNAHLIRIPELDYLNNGFLLPEASEEDGTYNPNFGSNSWAVSGKLTSSGFPILCNDPHLQLTFPNIWLQMQLTSKDVNVYGVSIPGIPAVIIGFNENIAWGVTNGATDVKDWYKLQLSDDSRSYKYDGEWVELLKHIEEIKIKGHHSIFDTISMSIHGPIVYDNSFDNNPALKNHALRWELQNSSNEFLAFYKLNKATSFKEYKDAIKHYSTPIQNFTFAGNDNTIAINHQGKIPVRWPGQGKFILDGTKSSHLTTQYIPLDSLPEEINPSQGYVLSANQRPTNDTYPYFYSGFFSTSRAIQIDKLLRNSSKLNIEYMKQVQLDNTNSFAVTALPVFFSMIDNTALSDVEKRSLESLKIWNGTYDFSDPHAKFFELWMEEIRESSWSELKKLSFYSRSPDDYTLLDLIQKNPESEWFDDIETKEEEKAGDVITVAFQRAVSTLNTYLESHDTRWGISNPINILHMTNLRAFSILNLPSAGHPNAINAVSKNWGPSWRMIVQLGETPIAYGIYPGGQSGNVGSKYYDNFVRDWNNGLYLKLQFFKNRLDACKNSVNHWSFQQ